MIRIENCTNKTFIIEPPCVVKSPAGNIVFIKISGKTSTFYNYTHLPVLYFSKEPITVSNRQIKYQLPAYYRTILNELKLPDYKIVLTNNIKGRMFYNSHILVNKYCLRYFPAFFFILFHEFAHHFYRSNEMKCDLFSMLMCLYLKIPPSQIVRAICLTLTPSRHDNIERMLNILKSVKFVYEK